MYLTKDESDWRISFSPEYSSTDTAFRRAPRSPMNNYKITDFAIKCFFDKKILYNNKINLYLSI